MRRRISVAALVAPWLILLATAAASQDIRPLPMEQLADRGLDGIELALDLQAHRDLAGLSAVRLAGMALPLPDGSRRPVVLALARVSEPWAADVVRIGGRRVTAAWHDELMLWRGHVEGDADSHVFLGFSRLGSRGWIVAGGSRFQLVADPGPDGAWEQSTSRLVDGRRLVAQRGPRPFTCGTAPSPAERLPLPGAPEGRDVPLPILEAAIAVETDTQFFELFGSLGAAQAYAKTVFAAVSQQYIEQLGVVLWLEYLGLHDGPDPWATPDTPEANTAELHDEFESAWNAGDAPVAAQAFYFMSGMNGTETIGGLATVGFLCSPNKSFAVGARNDGQLPLPLEQGPDTWDFYVMAHELGHVFSANHTHEYCPPIDECAPAQLFGECQDEQLCVDGTLMSYCYLCPGEMANVLPAFHPQIADLIRTFVVEESCLQPFAGVSKLPLPDDYALPNGGGPPPMLDVGFTEGQGTPGDPHVVRFVVRGAPPSATGVNVIGLFPIFAPFEGGVFVPDPEVLLFHATAGGSYVLPAPLAFTLPQGATVYAHVWYPPPPGGAGWAATNAVAFELVLPDPPPGLAWVPHPGNGMEYALSHTGSFADVRAQADALGARLVTVTDGALDAWLVATFAGALPNPGVFLGLTDEAAEGDFAWDSGAPVGYVNWEPGQPDDAGPSGEDYAELWFATGTWRDGEGAGVGINRGLLERAPR